MTIQLERLSPRELDALITKAKKRKSALGKRKPVAAVRRKVAALAKAEGYTIDELFGTAKAAPKPRKAAGRPPGTGRLPLTTERGMIGSEPSTRRLSPSITSSSELIRRACRSATRIPPNSSASTPKPARPLNFIFAAISGSEGIRAS